MSDYMADMEKFSKSAKQSVPAEPGNNGTIDTEKGKEVPEGSYAAGIKEAQK